MMREPVAEIGNSELVKMVKAKMRSLRAARHNIKIPGVLRAAFAAQFLIAGGIMPSGAAAREFAPAQEMAPGPQNSDSQSPTPPSNTPDYATPQSPAPQSQPPESAPPPPYDPTIFQKPVPGNQLTFLNAFAGQASYVAMQDKQFRKLLHTVLPDCIFHYGSDMPLFNAIDTVISGSQIPVQIRDGRYVLVSGRNGPYLSGRGFIWIDTQTGIALGGFYFHPTNGEPTPTVNIFSKQVKEKSLEMSQLPPAFAEDLNQWSADNGVPTVTTRYFITGNNEKILLAHDEDYCTPPPGADAPDEDTCEQMNADAADIDMNAAYYVEQTHHATNATAWMIIDDDQRVWIGVRDNTCSIGPDPLACHIRMTRDRTRVILHRAPSPQPPHH
jgi:uncharacterized protein YecT (DUF1311 family)